MTAARRPESQEQILEAAVASLTEADIPPDEEDYGWRDPDVEPPAELVALSDAELEELLAAAPCSAGTPPAWPLSYQVSGRPGRAAVAGRVRAAATAPAGALGFAGGTGAGFADGGPLDTLPAGMTLAGLADDAHARAGELDDDCLVGVLRAWRRLASWAQARELAAVAALARRRPADGSTARGRARRVSREAERVHRRRGRRRAHPHRPGRRGRAGPGAGPGRPAGHGGGAGGRADRPAPGQDPHRHAGPAVARAGRRGGGADPAPGRRA